MNIKKQYNLNNDSGVSIFIESDENSHFLSFIHDIKDEGYSFSATNEQLKGLADFIYETIGLSKKIQLTERNKIKIPPYQFDD
jgi:hypothetical protein